MFLDEHGHSSEARAANKAAVRGEQMPGVTQMGSNAGGVNILRSPEWSKIQAKHGSLLEESMALAKEGKTIESAAKELAYWKSVTDEFWERVNKPWLDQAMSRGDQFRLISDPAAEKAIYVTRESGEFVLGNGNKVKAIFGREVDYLRSKATTSSAMAPRC